MRGYNSSARINKSAKKRNCGENERKIPQKSIRFSINLDDRDKCIQIPGAVSILLFEPCESISLCFSEKQNTAQIKIILKEKVSAGRDLKSRLPDHRPGDREVVP